MILNSKVSDKLQGMIDTCLGIGRVKKKPGRDVQPSGRNGLVYTLYIGQKMLTLSFNDESEEDECISLDTSEGRGFPKERTKF